MESTKTSLSNKRWERDEYFISTNPELIPISSLAEVFALKEVHWAQPLPPQAAREMLDNSLTFGLYCTGQSGSSTADQASASSSSSPGQFIGVARCLTDFVTFIYLTDVWVDDGFKGQGLGKWLVKCVGEVIDGMPYLRRSLLFTGDWARSVPFYEQILGMDVLEIKRNEGLAVMEKKGPAHPDYGKSA